MWETSSLICCTHTTEHTPRRNTLMHSICACLSCVCGGAAYSFFLSSFLRSRRLGWRAAHTMPHHMSTPLLIHPGFTTRTSHSSPSGAGRRRRSLCGGVFSAPAPSIFHISTTTAQPSECFLSFLQRDDLHHPREGVREREEAHRNLCSWLYLTPPSTQLVLFSASYTHACEEEMFSRKWYNNRQTLHTTDRCSSRRWADKSEKATDTTSEGLSPAQHQQTQMRHTTEWSHSHTVDAPSLWYIQRGIFVFCL